MKCAVLLLLSAGMSFAGTWSGRLVDAGCWGFEERNINPSETLQSVDRDQNQEIGMCAPKAHTKSFLIVQPDGTTLQLDAAGNTKASALVSQTGKKKFYPVTVTGEAAKDTIAVTSIEAAK